MTSGDRMVSGWKVWGVPVAFAVLVVTLGAAVAASAEPECPKWFPDFAENPECDRQVRPAGSVMPMSFPYLFEDPYITTGLNFVGIWHEFPGRSVFRGGQLGVLALQARLAITDRVAFIATKDGIGFLDSDQAVIDDEDGGIFNISAGFKVAAWQWEGENASAILTPSLRYEVPVGQRKVFQGHDDGILIPAATAAVAFGSWHGILGLGGQVPIDKDENSSYLFYNVHLDHAFPVDLGCLEFVVPFLEVNGLHYTASGDGGRRVKTTLGKLRIEDATAALGLTPFEGLDVVNLGSSRVSGNNIVTMAWGLRLPMTGGLSLGTSYERPITERKDLFKQRVTVMLTWEL